MQVKVQNSELFSIQATLKCSPVILAQAPMSEPKHLLLFLYSIHWTKLHNPTFITQISRIKKYVFFIVKCFFFVSFIFYRHK